jgi:hypothetical protein
MVDAMTQPGASRPPLTEAKRMEIFAAVVQAQDSYMGLQESRQLVAGQFGVRGMGVAPIRVNGSTAATTVP